MSGLLPSPADRLERAEAFLSRSDLRELGLERRAVFGACPVVALPCHSRRSWFEDVRAMIEACDRVRP